jgi:hypothetical protein
MARITDAGKDEVLHELTIEEYNTLMRSRVNNEGSGSITIEIRDPKRDERNSLRTVIEAKAVEAVADESTIEDFVAEIVEEIEARNAKAVHQYGEKKDQPLPHSISIWVDADVAAALANLFSTDNLTNDARKAIREALETASGNPNITKGF